MTIIDITAFPTSFPVSPRGGEWLGIGRAVERDAVGAAGQAYVSHDKLFRDQLVTAPPRTRPDGTVLPPESRGSGWRSTRTSSPHPGIEGPGFVR